MTTLRHIPTAISVVSNASTSLGFFATLLKSGAGASLFWACVPIAFILFLERVVIIALPNKMKLFLTLISLGAGVQACYQYIVFDPLPTQREIAQIHARERERARLEAEKEQEQERAREERKEKEREEKEKVEHRLRMKKIKRDAKRRLREVEAEITKSVTGSKTAIYKCLYIGLVLITGITIYNISRSDSVEEGLSRTFDSFMGAGMGACAGFLAGGVPGAVVGGAVGMAGMEIKNGSPWTLYLLATGITILLAVGVFWLVYWYPAITTGLSGLKIKLWALAGTNVSSVVVGGIRLNIMATNIACAMVGVVGSLITLFSGAKIWRKHRPKKQTYRRKENQKRERENSQKQVNEPQKLLN